MKTSKPREDQMSNEKKLSHTCPLCGGEMLRMIRQSIPDKPLCYWRCSECWYHVPCSRDGATVEMANPRRCESCGDDPDGTTVDGVPLCTPCAEESASDAADPPLHWCTYLAAWASVAVFCGACILSARGC